MGVFLQTQNNNLVKNIKKTKLFFLQVFISHLNFNNTIKQVKVTITK